MAIFERYGPVVPSAAHAIEVLKTFRDSVSKPLSNTIAMANHTCTVYHGLGASANPSRFHDSQAQRFAPDMGMYFMPDPLTEEWFSQQVVNLDFQDMF
ncbi:hypothetical protein ABVK25_012409 [Lepraria finkii]|uniref:Uncharacterized protein n=1 Tax=Lepraria finkii TaxID=1340010 RepID=A0ABR4AG95_9LECA